MKPVGFFILYIKNIIHVGNCKIIADLINFTSHILYISFMNKNGAILFK